MDGPKSGHITLSWDMKEFSDALKLYEEATQQEMANVINHKAQRICMGAAADISAAQKLPNFSTGLFNALATGKTSRGELRMGSAVKGKGNHAKATEIFKSRKRAYGYSRAIWRKLAVDLGKKLTNKFNIKHATGIQAKKGARPTARMTINGLEQDHIDRFMQPALEKAISEEAASMVEHALDKLAKIAAQRSGRKVK